MLAFDTRILDSTVHCEEEGNHWKKPQVNRGNRTKHGISEDLN